MVTGLYIFITLAVMLGALYLIFRLNPDSTPIDHERTSKNLRQGTGHRLN